MSNTDSGQLIMDCPDCPWGFIPENACPYYNFRGTGGCWVDYVERTVAAKEQAA